MSSTEELRELLFKKYPGVKPPKITDALTEQINMLIEDAVNILKLDRCRWGDLYTTGILLLSAHFITVAIAGPSNSGVLIETTSEMPGGKTTTRYQAGSVKNLGQYSTTKYGREFDAMEARINKKKKSFRGRAL
jgi:hypothetical protein